MTDLIHKKNRRLSGKEVVFLLTTTLAFGAFLLSFSDETLRCIRWPALFVLMAAVTVYYGAMFWRAWEIKRILRLQNGSGTPVHKLADLLLFQAASDNADRIVFGEPPSPYAVEIIEYQSLQKDAAEDHMTEKEAEDLEGLNGLIDQIEMSDPFRESPLQKIPVWYKRGEKWHQGAPLPLRLLAPVVEILTLHALTDYHIKTGDLTVYRIKYLVGMESNYCYSVTIKEVGKQ